MGPEQARINEEIMQQLAQICTGMQMMMKQSQERVNAVVYQPPHAPIYEESYYDKDAYFIADQTGDFWTNAQGSNQDYWL